MLKPPAIMKLVTRRHSCGTGSLKMYDQEWMRYPAGRSLNVRPAATTKYTVRRDLVTGGRLKYHCANVLQW